MAFQQAKPYDEGYQAAVLQRGPNSSPYKEGTKQRREWDKGYIRGKLMSLHLGGNRATSGRNNQEY